MTRDGTVGRSDATERSLPFHWDIDPARVMRPRFADSIRASSPSGLREQAGHMTASDFCAARYIFSCQPGAIHNETPRVIRIIFKPVESALFALKVSGTGSSQTLWIHPSFASHSITSSARSRIAVGTSMPSALATFKLTASSILVGCCTGKSRGFSPLRIRPT
jgi:hypothetical protein